MNPRKNQKVTFSGFGYSPVVNQAGLCLDECKVLRSAKEQGLDWPSGIWLVVSPRGRTYWVHKSQMEPVKNAAG